MRTGWGERELDLPRAPGRRLAARAPAAGWPRRSPASGWSSRPAGSRCAPTTPTTGSAPTPRTPTSPATRPATPCWSSRTASRCSTPGPRSSRETDEFFRDRQYGELWAGRRPSLKEISDSLGLEVRHLDELDGAPRRHRQDPRAPRRRPVVDRPVAGDDGRDHDFARVLSEMRLVKDAWELEQLQEACDITTLGFEDSRARVGRRAASTASAGSRARSSAGPARWATTSATTRSSAAARTPRRCTGSRTPARSRPASCVLLDMGVEGRNLYTADVTRTLPVDGTLHAAAARPLHARARRPAGRHRRRAPGRAVPGRRTTRRWTCSPTGSTTSGCCRSRPRRRSSPDSKVYARWTLHGTSHMLGMDVHDCARGLRRDLPARRRSRRAWC